jgi:hypothetical protein
MLESKSFIYSRLARFLGKQQQTEQVAFMTTIFGKKGLDMLQDIKVLYPDFFIQGEST